MQNLEYTTIDKSAWGSGPWQSEVDKRQWCDLSTGLACMIRRAGADMGHWCGYVGVTKSHPAFGKGYDDVDVDIHGGLTFAEKCSHGDEATAICHRVEAGEDDDVWWFGFDCAHAFDLVPGMAARIANRNLGFPMRDDVYRTQEYVVAEVERLAKQLFALKG